MPAGISRVLRQETSFEVDLANDSIEGKTWLHVELGRDRLGQGDVFNLHCLVDDVMSIGFSPSESVFGDESAEFEDLEFVYFDRPGKEVMFEDMDIADELQRRDILSFRFRLCEANNNACWGELEVNWPIKFDAEGNQKKFRAGEKVVLFIQYTVSLPNGGVHVKEMEDGRKLAYTNSLVDGARFWMPGAIRLFDGPEEPTVIHFTVPMGYTAVCSGQRTNRQQLSNTLGEKVLKFTFNVGCTPSAAIGWVICPLTKDKATGWFIGPTAAAPSAVVQAVHAGWEAAHEVMAEGEINSTKKSQRKPPPSFTYVVLPVSMHGDHGWGDFLTFDGLTILGVDAVRSRMDPLIHIQTLQSLVRAGASGRVWPTQYRIIFPESWLFVGLALSAAADALSKLIGKSRVRLLEYQCMQTLTESEVLPPLSLGEMGMYSGELYSNMWCNRSWLAVRSLRIILHNAVFPIFLERILLPNRRKDLQMIIMEMEKSEVRLIGWREMWLEIKTPVRVQANMFPISTRSKAEVGAIVHGEAVHLKTVSVRTFEAAGVSTQVVQLDAGAGYHTFAPIARSRKKRKDAEEVLAQPLIIPNAIPSGKIAKFPVLFIRVDPDLLMIRTIENKQGQARFAVQLARDRDPTSQIEAMRELEPSSNDTVMSCQEFMELDSCVSSVRSEAAWLLSKSGKLTGSLRPGAQRVIKFAETKYFNKDTGGRLELNPLIFKDFGSAQLMAGIFLALGRVARDLATPEHAHARTLIRIAIEKFTIPADSPVQAPNLRGAIAFALLMSCNDSNQTQDFLDLIRKTIEFDALVPSPYRLVSVLCILGLGECIASGTAQITMKIGETTLRNYLLSFLSVDHDVHVRTAAAHAVGRLITHDVTCSLALLKLANVDSVSAVRLACLNAFSQADQRLRTSLLDSLCTQVQRDISGTLKLFRKVLAGNAELCQEVSDLVWSCMTDKSTHDLHVRVQAAVLYGLLFGSSLPSHCVNNPEVPKPTEILVEQVLFENPAHAELRYSVGTKSVMFFESCSWAKRQQLGIDTTSAAAMEQ